MFVQSSKPLPTWNVYKELNNTDDFTTEWDVSKGIIISYWRWMIVEVLRWDLLPEACFHEESVRTDTCSCTASTVVSAWGTLERYILTLKMCNFCSIWHLIPWTNLLQTSKKFTLLPKSGEPVSKTNSHKRSAVKSMVFHLMSI